MRSLVLLFLLVLDVFCDEASRARLLITTVSRDDSDSVKRLRASAEAFGLDLKVFTSNNLKNKQHLDGAEKLRILRSGLEAYKDRADLLILYADPESILNADENEIVGRFLKHFGEFRIVFSSSSVLGANEQFASDYPEVEYGNKFLSSRMFIGHAPEVYKMVNSGKVADADTDGHIFFSSFYLNAKKQRSLKVTIDSMSRLFQNLEGALDEVVLQFSDSGESGIFNAVYNTHPVIMHGEGISTLFQNYIGNYAGKAWNADLGCISCKPIGEYAFLKDGKSKEWPTVTLALFIPKAIPFVSEFLATVEALDYPKSRMDLYIFNNQKYNEKDVKKFAKQVHDKYHSVQVDNYESELGEREARRAAIDIAMKTTDYVFLLDAEVHITDTDTLRAIIDSALIHKAGVIAPMISKPYKLFSNFWGALTEDGFYARSEDYTDIVYGKRTGTWNVPYIKSAILIAKNKMEAAREAYSYNPDNDLDMSFCEYAREKGHFLYVDNQRYYGFLADSDSFASYDNRLHPEMYQIFENRHLWERRYVNPGYYGALNGSAKIPMPCPDVYDYPLLSETFAHELVEEMEHFGKWSNGQNKDDRLAGGYENVPTVDIHMNQIGFERHWLYFLDEFVRPMQEKLFIGYYQQPVDAIMMFVVRYHPDEQPYLRAHHDASTYTVDIPLNKRGRDYEGGGVRYIRYDCTVPADQIGHAAMFPGRLTHLHEGLPTTHGIRYIAVSFLNP